MLNRFLFITVLFLFFSCGNEKVLQLPEIQNADITEVLDVSPAYIFYDETKQDSVELNRKNLIISTNWLVNVDKRLTLEQALPSIIKLQEKKRNATMHKNEKAKNYYTCNDTSIKNLGFIDFTNIYYVDSFKSINLDSINQFNELVFTKTKTSLITNNQEIVKNDFNDLNLLYDYLKENDKSEGVIFLNFKKDLNFQEYITFKKKLQSFKNLNFSNYEIIND